MANCVITCVSVPANSCIKRVFAQKALDILAYACLYLLQYNDVDTSLSLLCPLSSNFDDNYYM